MLKRKIVWLVVSVLIILSMALASCGKAEPATTATSGTTAEPATAEPQYGGTLTLLDLWHSTSADPESWDPSVYNWLNSEPLKYHMETILVGDIDNKGPRGDNTYIFDNVNGVPASVVTGHLCDTWEVVDSNTIRLHVRQGVKFQSNPKVMAQRELNADDIAFSLNKMITGPTIASRFTWIDSITAPDKSTVLVKLNKFNADWQSYLGYYYYAQIYPQEMITAGAADWHNAVGTGPFIVSDYIRGSMRTYKKNPDYWGTTTINGKKYQLPFIDELRFPVMPDVTARLAALRTGKVDINASVTWQDKASLAKTNADLTVFKAPYAGGHMINMRVDTKPFTDINVRRALNLAIDKQAIISAMLGGEGVLLNLPFTSDWPEYTPLEEYPHEVQEIFGYNPDKAKQLLADAGYPQGFETQLIISDTFMTSGLPSLVVDSWSKIGVKCELKTYDYSTFETVIFGKQQTQMIWDRTGAPTALGALFKFCITGASVGGAFLSDPIIDQAYKDASAETDPLKALALARKGNEQYVKDVPQIWLPAEYTYEFCWPWVKNWYGEISAGSFDMGVVTSRIWIDPDLKQKMGY
ncbi:MAG: ABC transporter substrate-binding protein [Dehalococcoidales bacterium]|nr:ABC transporter substrate-binding protein [Dehalococcoidales bacterium]